VEEVLGSGAMATVYRAIQQALERKVALKLMAEHLSANSEYHERFLNEAKHIAKLNHPNVITIHDVNLYQSHYYIAMEYLSGGTLRERIRKGLTPPQALNILRQIAAALDCAHQQEIIHRDVKPANILFRADGTAVLSDFGIAKRLNDDAGLTKEGFIVGTPYYMSPEQGSGKGIDARSDLYALGVVFYEMLTGQVPYRGSDTTSTIIKHMTDPVPRLPDNLLMYQPLIDRLMAKKGEDRIQTAAELIQAIDQLLAMQATASGAATAILPPAKSLPARPRRSYFQALVGARLLIGLAAAAVGSFRFEEELKCRWQPLELSVDYFYRTATEEELHVLTPDASIHSGDHYKIQFSSAQDAYVYVFQIDSSDQIFQLFPPKDFSEVAPENTGSAAIKAGQTYYIPDQDKSFQLDEQVGKERIYVLAFRQPNTELEQLYRELGSAREQQSNNRINELHSKITGLLNKGGCDQIGVLSFNHI
jgi:serine/threonine-protein kinase PpkA